MTFGGTITLGDVVQLVFIFAGLILAYARLDRRLAVVEFQLRQMNERGCRGKDGD